MIRNKEDYTRYYPPSSALECWGIWISGSGKATIAAGHEYPPIGHPADHHFQWKEGRVLEALQVVLITHGSGWLETREHGKKKIMAGMAFLLLPGVWHRYRPNPKTGWRESWIEIQGPLINQILLQHHNITSPIVRRGSEVEQIEEVSKRIHQLSRDGEATRPELAAEAMRCLALLAKGSHSQQQGGALRTSIFKAEQYLASHYAEPLDMQQLATLLGLSYSSFRRAFLHQTGLSPWQFLLQIRLVKARQLLASRESKLEDVAAETGFSSGFHLSAFFKKTFGVSPSQWRKNIHQN